MLARFLLWTLSFVAAAFLALFLASLVFMQSSPPASPEKKDMPGPSAPDSAFAQPSAKSAEPVLGQAKSGLFRDFEWPQDGKLRMAAMLFFSGRKDWNSCLYLAGLMDKTELPEENCLGYAQSYYDSFIPGILADELHVEGAALGEGGKALAQGGGLGELPLSQALLLLNNLRAKMAQESVPQPVADILLQAFVRERGDSFSCALVRDMIAKAPEPRRSYAEAGTFLKNSLAANPNYFDIRMELHCSELARDIAAAPEELRSWLLRASQKSSQAKAFHEALKKNPNGLSLKTYSELAPTHRWLLAQRLSASLSSADRELFFSVPQKMSAAAKYRDALRNELKAESMGVLFLRQNPHWISALNTQSYDDALSVLKNDCESLCGFPLNTQLFGRIVAPLELERKLWKQRINVTEWKKALDAAGGDKPSERDAVFIGALKLFLPPPEQRSELQTVLLAVCLLNRGDDPRYLHLKADTQQNILKKYLPEREMNGD